MDRRQVVRALSGLLMVLFVAMISTTIVAVALPQIIGSLNGTQAQYTWVVTALLLTSTASTPVWGKLADLFDKKLLIQIALVIFTVSSLACGFAQTTEQLIAFRAAQGLGMGALQVLVQVVIGVMTTPRERGRYHGYIGVMMAVATVSGPLLGGLLTDVSWLGWRWCFFSAVPFTVVALVLLSRTLHLVSERREDARVDYAGATLIAAGVSTLLLWVTFVGNTFPWLSWQTAAMTGGGVLTLVAAVWVESRVREPVIPLHIVTRRNSALAILASLAVGVGMFGGVVFLGQYFQVGRGHSPTEAGLLTTPMMLGVMVFSTLAGHLASRTGKVKALVVTGSVILTGGFLWLSTIDHATSLLEISAAMVLTGMGIGLSLQNLVLVVQNSVPLRELGAASGAITFFRSLGGTIGVSVLGAVLAAHVNAEIARGYAAAGVAPTGEQSSNLNLEALPGTALAVVRTAYADVTGTIFLVAAAVAVVGVLATLLLRPITLRDTIDLPAGEKPGRPAERTAGAVAPGAR
ncbi:MDR family MFS transporter [Streptomyces sodiiphilus]